MTNLKPSQRPPPTDRQLRHAARLTPRGRSLPRGSSRTETRSGSSTRVRRTEENLAASLPPLMRGFSTLSFERRIAPKDAIGSSPALMADSIGAARRVGCRSLAEPTITLCAVKSPTSTFRPSSIQAWSAPTYRGCSLRSLSTDFPAGRRTRRKRALVVQSATSRSGLGKGNDGSSATGRRQCDFGNI